MSGTQEVLENQQEKLHRSPEPLESKDVRKAVIFQRIALVFVKSIVVWAVDLETIFFSENSIVTVANSSKGARKFWFFFILFGWINKKTFSALVLENHPSRQSSALSHSVPQQLTIHHHSAYPKQAEQSNDCYLSGNCSEAAKGMWAKQIQGNVRNINCIRIQYTEYSKFWVDLQGDWSATWKCQMWWTFLVQHH